jgi:hypothetical protein
MNKPGWIWLMLGGISLVCVAILLRLWTPAWQSVGYVADVPGTAAKVLGTLAILALLIERSLSVLNNIIFSEEEHRVQASLASKTSELRTLQQEIRVAAEQQRAVARQAVAVGDAASFAAVQQEATRSLAVKDAQTANLREQVANDEQSQAIIDAAKERNRLAFAFGFAFLVAVAGVRALSPLVFPGDATVNCSSVPVPAGCTFKDLQGALITVIDILLTAGLLAGGSNGLAKIIEAVKPSARGGRATVPR